MTVLVLRALGIGYLATAVPALRGIRTAWPSHRLKLAAPAWLAPLVPLIGVVDELAVTSGSLGHPPLVSSGPDVAVNLHGRGPLSTRLLRRLKPKRTLAFNIAKGPIWYQDEHEVTRWCRMLKHYGIDCDETDLALRRPNAPPPVHGATVLHIGAKSPENRWDPSHFARVAAELERDGHRVVVTGKDVRWSGPGLNLVGRLDLEHLAALVADSRLVLSGDTGVAHLATAYSRPSVLLFGPKSPRLWGPPESPLHRVLWDPITRSVDAITVDEVLSAVRVQAECLP